MWALSLSTASGRGAHAVALGAAGRSLTALRVPWRAVRIRLCAGPQEDDDASDDEMGSKHYIDKVALVVAASSHAMTHCKRSQ